MKVLHITKNIQVTWTPGYGEASVLNPSSYPRLDDVLASFDPRRQDRCECCEPASTLYTASPRKRATSTLPLPQNQINEKERKRGEEKVVLWRQMDMKILTTFFFYVY